MHKRAAVVLTRDPGPTLAVKAVLSTHLDHSSAVSMDEIAAFSELTERLLDIGAVSFTQYTNLSTPGPSVVAPSHHQSHVVQPTEGYTVVKGPISRLHQACEHTFGSAGALIYTYEDVPEQGMFDGFFVCVSQLTVSCQANDAFSPLHDPMGTSGHISPRQSTPRSTTQRQVSLLMP